MPLTAAERARLTGLWLALARASITPDPDALKEMDDARKWASPLDRREQAFVLFALASLTHAFARAGMVARLEMVDALVALGALAQRVLAAEGPPQGELRFRRDIDG